MADEEFRYGNQCHQDNHLQAPSTAGSIDTDGTAVGAHSPGLENSHSFSEDHLNEFDQDATASQDAIIDIAHSTERYSIYSNVKDGK
ncbi:hypothetical protein BG011_001934, partial [Mortierella polycephala]